MQDLASVFHRSPASIHITSQIKVITSVTLIQIFNIKTDCENFTATHPTTWHEFYASYIYCRSNSCDSRLTDCETNASFVTTNMSRLAEYPDWVLILDKVLKVCRVERIRYSDKLKFKHCRMAVRWCKHLLQSRHCIVQGSLKHLWLANKENSRARGKRLQEDRTIPYDQHTPLHQSP